MPLPYMGSKRKSAGKIYQTIKNFSPDATILVDLFCGGFAISEYFIKNGWSVLANDKNKYVIALLKEVTENGLDEKRCTEFITREKFFDVLKNKEKYEDWFIGYVMCIWSFGNNQKGYLFGKDTEVSKQAGHELVINKNPDLILSLMPSFPQKYIDGILKQETWQKRRLALKKVAKALQLEQLEQLQQLQRLEQLEQLQRLEQLQQLEQRQMLTSTAGDYRDIEIPKGAVVYCDPPYINTAEYAEGSFNHAEFWDYVRNLSKTNKVYVSSYVAPDDFKKILEFPQRSSLQGGQNNSQPNECLFVIKNSKG